MKIRFMIVFLAFGILPACSLLNMAKFKKPKVEITKVQLKKIDFKTVDLVFEVLVNNPNDFDLSMQDLNYEVEMNGNKVATQNVKGTVEVKALKASNVKLPLSLDYSQIFGSIGDFLKARESTYTIKGSADFGILTLPFSESGQLRLDKGKLTHKKL